MGLVSDLQNAVIDVVPISEVYTQRVPTASGEWAINNKKGADQFLSLIIGIEHNDRNPNVSFSSLGCFLCLAYPLEEAKKRH